MFSTVALGSAGSTLLTLRYQAAAPLGLVDTLLFGLVVPLLFAAIGVLIVARVPGNRVGWLLLTPALAITVLGLLDSYLLQQASVALTPTPLLLALFWLGTCGWLWLVFPLLLIAQLFPNGHALAPRWRLLAAGTLMWAALFALLAALSRSYVTIDPPYLELINPYGLIDLTQLDRIITVIWFPGLLLLTGLSAIAVLLRYRRAGSVEREQMKWLLYACVLFAAVYIGGGVLGISGEPTTAGQMHNLLFTFTVCFIPLAIGGAVLRYRLFDIDVIIRRTLVYALLTFSLGAIYFGSVVALQTVFVRLTGQASTLAVVASTLVIAALFGPLRGRVQAFIDRRFFRKKYNAQLVLEQFAQRAQQQADLDTVSADVLATVQETLEPEGVQLWLLRRSGCRATMPG
ncbi:hypothetical protein HC891_05095 [Candidatus Gracilibacteria bacterium]|nr:hypothetical protein [Candidatus Gracilibacteria bacterium]